MRRAERNAAYTAVNRLTSSTMDSVRVKLSFRGLRRYESSRYFADADSTLCARASIRSVTGKSAWSSRGSPAASCDGTDTTTCTCSPLSPMSSRPI